MGRPEGLVEDSKSVQGFSNTIRGLTQTQDAHATSLHSNLLSTLGCTQIARSSYNQRSPRRPNSAQPAFSSRHSDRSRRSTISRVIPALRALSNAGAAVASSIGGRARFAGSREEDFLLRVLTIIKLYIRFRHGNLVRSRQ